MVGVGTDMLDNVDTVAVPGSSSVYVLSEVVFDVLFDSAADTNIYLFSAAVMIALKFVVSAPLEECNCCAPFTCWPMVALDGDRDLQA